MIHEVNHDPLMIAHQTGVRLYVSKCVYFIETKMLIQVITLKY